MVGCILSLYITMSETDRFKNPDNNITSTSMKIANRGVERITLKDGYNRIGNLQGVVPDGWIRENPSNSMRLAQFNISGKSERCELIIFSGIGGSVDANLNRWLGQFLNPDKKRMTDYSTVRNEKIHELEISVSMNWSRRKNTLSILGPPSSEGTTNQFFTMTVPQLKSALRASFFLI